MGFEFLNGARILEGQAGLQLLGGGEFGARQGCLAGTRKQFSLDEMRLGAVRVIGENLADHLLRLIEMTAHGRGVDLVDRGIGIGKHGGARGHHESGAHCNSCGKD